MSTLLVIGIAIIIFGFSSTQWNHSYSFIIAIYLLYDTVALHIIIEIPAVYEYFIDFMAKLGQIACADSTN